MKDFWNSNGLINGRIPKGNPCPFWAECSLCDMNCPVPGRIKPVNFSCGCARGMSLSKMPVNDESMKFFFSRPDEETLEIKLGDHPLLLLTHDQHGWEGLKIAESLVTEIAKILRIEVEEK